MARAFDESEVCVHTTCGTCGTSFSACRSAPLGSSHELTCPNRHTIALDKADIQKINLPFKYSIHSEVHIYLDKK